MAYYASLVSLVQLLEDVLHRDLYSNFLHGKRRGIVKSLHRKFIGLEKELLQGYSSRGTQVTDDVETQIRDVTSRVQDIIEYKISFQIFLQEQTDVPKLFYWVIHACQKAFFCLEPELEVSDKVLFKLEQDVDLIVQQVVTIKESQRNEDSSHINYYAAAETGEMNQAQAPDLKDAMVGFDQYLITIKEQLCGHSSHLQVIPILGMGGIGKTTLAKSAFDDPLIQYYFDFRAWVATTQEYNIGQVLQDIARSIDKEQYSKEDKEEYSEEDKLCAKKDRALAKEKGQAQTIEELLEALKEKGQAQTIEELLKVLKEGIYKYLKGRRYMIVIDDIWSTQALDDLKHVLPDDNNGSRIMLTTRLFDVANYSINATGFLHRMSFLNEGQSWDLLRKKVFIEEQCPPDLEELGKIISSKCQGLPLAIVVMAGILSSDRTPLSWQKVAKNINMTLNKSDDEHLSNILSSSYNHLPHQLKACFLHMGCFPEDYTFNISNLIKLWVAEGLLKSVNGFETIEEVGEECIVDLVKRNLVIVTQKRANGQFKKCIVHDLLRDFCRQRAFHEDFFQQGHLDQRGVKIMRRVYLYGGSPHKLIPHVTAKLVRSILCFSKGLHNPLQRYSESQNEDLDISNWDSFKLLRVLDAPTERAWTITQDLWELLHLRYICLHVRDPWHIINHLVLHNLQTLIIHTSKSYLTLFVPPEFWKWTQLRHLVVTGEGVELPPNPPLFGSTPTPTQILGNLQTLLVVSDFKFTDEAIMAIPNLRKLKIRNYMHRYTNNWNYHALNNLVRLSHLHELKIHFHGLSRFEIEIFPSCFPSNLRKLSLRGCRLLRKEMSMIGSLPVLQVLKLDHDTLEAIWEPVEGEFLQLKFLLLRKLGLRFWRAEAAHFPRLEQLEINACWYLEEIPLELGDIPTLKLIYVINSRLSVTDSAIRILEEQQELENNDLQIRFSSPKNLEEQQALKIL